jgi:hypothetical protein
VKFSILECSTECSADAVKLGKEVVQTAHQFCAPLCALSYSMRGWQNWGFDAPSTGASPIERRRFLSEVATTAELKREFKRLRFQQRRYAERGSSNQATVPAIKMLLGDWYVD